MFIFNCNGTIPILFECLYLIKYSLLLFYIIIFYQHQHHNDSKHLPNQN